MLHMYLMLLSACCVAAGSEIHDALSAGEFDKAKKIIRSDVASVEAKNAEGRVPLHLAAGKGQKELVKLLLQKGASVKAQDDGGETPLHFAALFGYKEIVKLLLASNADVNAQAKFGGTPLHRAASMGHAAVAQLLLDNKADVNLRDATGQTPLDRALDDMNGVKGKEGVAEVIRSAGGKPGKEIQLRNSSIKDSIAKESVTF